MLSVFESVAERARFRYVKGMSRMSELTSVSCLSMLVTTLLIYDMVVRNRRSWHRYPEKTSGPAQVLLSR